MRRYAFALSCLTLALIGCHQASEGQSDTCRPGRPTAVAGDPATGVYMIVATAVLRAADAQVLVRFTSDGTTPGLLGPQSGGFILLNAGAGARRFDATGALMWTIGYGDYAGGTGTLLQGDQLVLADAGAVRSFDAGGALLWQRGIDDGGGPGTSEASVQAVTADPLGGVWVVGTTRWTLPFVLHLDGEGTELAGSSGDSAITYDEAIGSTDAGGRPLLIVRTNASGVQGAAAIDGAGRLVWNQMVQQGTSLAGDRAGQPFALAFLQSMFEMDHWNADGQSTSRALSAVANHSQDQAVWVTTPDSTGFLIAGQVSATPLGQAEHGMCSATDFLWQVDSADLTVKVQPLFQGLGAGVTP